MLLNVSQSHIITLSINTLLALLPLSTKTYYGTTDDEGKQVCTFSTGNGSMKNTLTWVDNLVHIELIICFIILFVLTVIIIFNDKCQRKNNLTTPFVESIQKGWITILFYP
jgi:heme/copper-type cytochrome/quinol oxidase subunit 2